MAIKTINTRIGLKYDSYANWTRPGTWSDGVFTPNAEAQTTYWEGFKPLAGEVVFFAIPASTGEVAQEPAILFKVGDGQNFLKDLPWGSAIAADVYNWAKQQSLLGGTQDQQTGNWTWSQDSVYAQEQAEVAAFVKKETANIKVKVDQVTEQNFQSIYGIPYDSTNPDHVAKIGKYQTSVSTTEDAQHNPIWEATGDVFAMTPTTYGAENGVALNQAGNFEIALKSGETNLVADSNGLSLTTATVTYTPAQAAVPGTEGVHWTQEEIDAAQEGDDAYGKTTDDWKVEPTAGTPAVPAGLTGTAGVVQGTDVAAIKSYVDAVAQAADTAGEVTVTSVTPGATYASAYEIRQGGALKGTINIPRDLLVKSASIETVDTADTPYTGAQVGDKYIDFVVNTAASQSGDAAVDHLYLPVNELVDVYTGNWTSGTDAAGNTDFVKIEVNAQNQISAHTYTQSLSTAHAAQAATYYSQEDYDAYVAEHDGATPAWNVGDEKTPAVAAVDGLATAVDVKTYVDNAVATATPNIQAGNGINITDSGNTKTVAVKLDDTHNASGIQDNTGSGLVSTSSGLAIDDSLEWHFACGGAN